MKRKRRRCRALVRSDHPGRQAREKRTLRVLFARLRSARNTFEDLIWWGKLMIRLISLLFWHSRTANNWRPEKAYNCYQAGDAPY